MMGIPSGPTTNGFQEFPPPRSTDFAAHRAVLGLPRLARDLRLYDRVLGSEELVGDDVPWNEAPMLAQALLSRNLD